LAQSLFASDDQNHYGGGPAGAPGNYKYNTRNAAQKRTAKRDKERTRDAIQHAPEVAEYYKGKKAKLSSVKDLWALDIAHRVLLIQFFIDERVNEVVSQLVDREREFSQLKEDKKRIQEEQRAAVFKSN
ncbi:unnamed protein product, partial [Amoebophrya sp. A25]